ncbi:MAG TPA: MBOAT family O-acyltransferase [Terriglobales bacterium]|nr:MBOAT family O-acyltransferase [Terriglobales bacterium]
MLLRTSLYIMVFIASLLFLKAGTPKVRRIVLLAGSYVLYSTWAVWFAVVLFASTVINFGFGNWIRKKSSALALPLGIVFNLLLLSSFKYVPQLAANLSLLHGFSHIALPLGISFWTFQAMSYLFDCHYRSENLDPSFVEFALYMSFFPVVISGPICRMPQMLPQFRSQKRTNWKEIGDGLSRMAAGILMMQLAKLLGQGILSGDGIASGFDHLSRWTGPDVWCLAFGYGLQLFFDFAGYSHMAIGAAKALGFTVPENFARPFQSITPSIFWTRWHMSLSFWIRDYVFLPFAMLRRELWWQNLGLILSMVIFGVWHKATLLFVLWGCYHGVLLVGHRTIQEFEIRLDWIPSERFWTPISWLVTMAAVSLGWIFFRAGSLGQAKEMLAVLVSPSTYASHLISGSLYLLVVGLAAGYAIVLLVSDMLAGHVHQVEAGSSEPIGIVTLAARWRWFWLPPIYALLLLFVSIITTGQGGTAAQLMYRRF